MDKFSLLEKSIFLKIHHLFCLKILFSGTGDDPKTGLSPLVDEITGRLRCRSVRSTSSWAGRSPSSVRYMVTSENITSGTRFTFRKKSISLKNFDSQKIRTQSQAEIRNYQTDKVILVTEIAYKMCFSTCHPGLNMSPFKPLSHQTQPLNLDSAH